MHFKKTIALLITLTIPLLFVNFTYVKVSGAHPGSTGAPGDKTCADASTGCHTGTVIKDDKTVNSLIFPTLDSTYVPGKTYQVAIKVKNPNIQRFGFCVVSLTEADNKNTGTLKITESTRTQLINHAVGGDTRYEVTHKQPGTNATSTGNNEWTFEWTAPATAQGNIIFYYATNSTNNNGQSSGDNIRLSQFKLKPAGPSGIDEFMDKNEVVALYNNDGNFLDIRYILKKECTVQVSVVDALGQQLYTDNGDYKNVGACGKRVDLPSYITTGIYFVNLKYGNNNVTRKIFIP